MDTRIKEVLEAKNCPLIYAADANDRLEISFRGSTAEIMSLVGKLIITVSIETGIPLDIMYDDFISESIAATLEQYEEQKERKAGKN